MSKALLAVGIAICIVDGGWHAVNGFLHAIDRGKAKRELADVRSIVSAIDSYKARNGHYPIAMNRAEFAQAMSPEPTHQLPKSELDYFSDGTTYAFVLWPWGSQPYPMREAAHGPLVVRDAVLVGWPSTLSINGPMNMRAAAGGTQPNNGINATVRPVTARAIARVAPVRPARYALR